MGMQHYLQLKRGVVIVAVLAAALCQSAPGQEAQGNDARSREAKGMPPRATPADYQAHAQAGKITIAAEFTGHSAATPEATFSTEDYVVFEVAFFGPDASIRLSPEDFSLRINGKKTPLPARPYALVFKSLKDPSWQPPVPVESKSKGGISTGGNGQSDSLPAIVHMPIEVERAMELRVQKASLPEGERPLPVAGLIFFEHRGKTNSIELIYAGPAGKATLTLQP